MEIYLATTDLIERRTPRFAFFLPCALRLTG